LGYILSEFKGYRRANQNNLNFGIFRKSSPNFITSLIAFSEYLPKKIIAVGIVSVPFLFASLISSINKVCKTQALVSFFLFKD
jgi:hypothetical protein